MCSKQWCQPFLYQCRLCGRRVSRETEHLSKLHKMFLQDVSGGVHRGLQRTNCLSSMRHDSLQQRCIASRFDVSWRRRRVHQEVFGSGISPYNKHICWNVYRRETTKWNPPRSGKTEIADSFPTICTTTPALCSSSASDCKRKWRSWTRQAGGSAVVTNESGSLFFYLRRKRLIRFAHTTKIKEHSSSCFFLHSLGKQRNNC